MRNKRPNIEALQAGCDAFNVAHPVGTHVTVKLDGNDVPFHTVTTSEAQILSGHSAVIWLKDVSGCYLLDRVKAVPPPKRTTSYMCLDVRGAIRNLQAQRSSKRTGMMDNKGNPLNKAQAIDALMDDLSRGCEVIPMSKGCGKPCKNDPRCAGFDYGANGGCPGHPTEPEAS